MLLLSSFADRSYPRILAFAWIAKWQRTFSIFPFSRLLAIKDISNWNIDVTDEDLTNRKSSANSLVIDQATLTIWVWSHLHNARGFTTWIHIHNFRKNVLFSMSTNLCRYKIESPFLSQRRAEKVNYLVHISGSIIIEREREWGREGSNSWVLSPQTCLLCIAIIFYINSLSFSSKQMSIGYNIKSGIGFRWFHVLNRLDLNTASKGKMKQE